MNEQVNNNPARNGRFVDYVDHMGSDLDVVNCARVSFDKEQAEIDILKDSKLINYLAKHQHWSPFSHQMVKFRFHVPMFVRNQLYKHMIGLNVSEAIGEQMAWNEVSRRYVDAEPLFFQPSKWRKKAENKKQGSLDVSVEDESAITHMVKVLYIDSLAIYKNLLENQVAPELARMILPQSVYTTWIWTGSLVAWSRICKQRLKEDTQYETRVVVAEIVPHMERLFPLSWEALMNDGR